MVRKRNMGLEYLRIISMLLIILLHSIDHSSLLNSLTKGTSIYYIEMFFYGCVQICVNCFIMISGYFLINSKFKVSKLIQLWVEVVFYSMFIKLLFMLIGYETFSISSLLSCFVPVITGRYWFITIYFGLYLVFPFLNIGIKAMSKKQHKVLCIISIILMSFANSIYPELKGMNSGGGWGLAWFVTLYVIASYIRLHYIPNQKPKTLFYFIIFLLCNIFVFLCLIVSNYVSIGVILNIVSNWYRYDSIFACIATISLFLCFVEIGQKKLKKQSKKGGIDKIIIALSSATFGVYLIHAHANMCTEEMWKLIGFDTANYGGVFPIYQIGVVFAIFIMCAVIDLLRQQLFKLFRINIGIDKVCNKININL